MTAQVAQVLPGTIAEQLGLKPGDELVRINGESIRDYLEYRFAVTDELLTLDILHRNGKTKQYQIEKDIDTDLGLVFSSDVFDGIRQCANRCLFCFVDQMPPEMRESLYVKDDDYRLSFLHGNFVTLTNLGKKDFERIQTMNLSPLYVSVHTTNPDLRVEMLGHQRAGRIMAILQELAEAGIEFHTQIVVCPGWNDGDELERTIQDLASLWPAVRSIGVVPVGLTIHRHQLKELQCPSAEEAKAVLQKAEIWRRQFWEEYGYPLIFLSDEWYVRAHRMVPSGKQYGGYPQLENGIGLLRLFHNELRRELPRLPQRVTSPQRMLWLTGASAFETLKQTAQAFQRRVDGLAVNVVPVENTLFGPEVTVAGLLSGADFLRTIRNIESTDLVVLPRVALRTGTETFLDGSTLGELRQHVAFPIEAVDGPADLVKLVCSLS